MLTAYTKTRQEKATYSGNPALPAALAVCHPGWGSENCTLPNVLSGSFSVSQATGSLTRLFSSLDRLAMSLRRLWKKISQRFC